MNMQEADGSDKDMDHLVERKNEATQTPQVRLEEAAIAVLIEKITRLDEETKDDLMAVLMDVRNCKTDEDRAEIEETMRELIYPDMMGDLEVGHAGVSVKEKSKDSLAKWSSNVGGTIKRLRQEKDMTQEELASAAGLPQSHISRLERGRHSPSHKTISAIAKALGVEVSQIDPAATED